MICYFAWCLSAAMQSLQCLNKHSAFFLSSHHNASVSLQWNPIVSVFLWVIYFTRCFQGLLTLYHVTKSVCFSKLESIPSYECAAFSSSTSPLAFGWILPITGFLGQATVDVVVQLWIPDLPLNSFGYKPKSAMGRSWTNFVFNFLKNLHAAFHTGSTILFPATVHVLSKPC